ncbi:response regulator transcription factor [Paenirhodobacter populi]|uniref:response regulator transcription factor n=1 Tax=Paenirhodobacter populi TaxID=2306993 RepID=UPI00374208B8
MPSTTWAPRSNSPDDPAAIGCWRKASRFRRRICRRRAPPNSRAISKGRPGCGSRWTSPTKVRSRSCSRPAVLALLVQGLGNKDIARKLSRSLRTIEHQVSSVLGKFNAGNRMAVLLRVRSEHWPIGSAREG